jgi:hypothetical protein
MSTQPNIILSVIMLSVANAEFLNLTHYAECRGATENTTLKQ